MSDETTVEPVETDPSVVELGGTAKPILRVVKGDLTPEELAALVAVVAARNAAAAHAAAGAKKRPRSAWGHPAAMARPAHRFGPDQWRRSAFGG